MPRGEAIGVIPIAMQAGCTGSDNETVVRSAGREAGHYLLEVEVRGPGPAHGRTFVLGAESYAERDDWFASLRVVAEAWRTLPPARTARAPSSGGRTPSPEEPPAVSRRRTATPELLTQPLSSAPRRAASSEGVPPTRPASGVSSRALRAGSEEALGEGDAARGRPKSVGAMMTSPRVTRGPEGILHKRGYWNTAWKARYFILTPRGDLEYYKMADGTRHGAPAGVIPVALRPGYRGEEEETVVRAGGRDGRMGVIELRVRMAGPACGRTYVLGAASGAEHERWMVALQRAAGAWRGEEHGHGPSDSFQRAGSREAALSPRQAGSSSEDGSEPSGPATAGTGPAARGAVLISGALEKRGRLNTAWKWRHFALTADGVLRYFASEADWLGGGEPKGRVPVAMPEGCWGRAHETLINEVGREEGRSMVEIHVQAPGPLCGRVFVLGAPSRAVQREWADALRQAAQAWRTAGREAASISRAASAAGPGRSQGPEELRPAADPRRTKSPEALASYPDPHRTKSPEEHTPGPVQGRRRSPEAGPVPAVPGSHHPEDRRRSPEFRPDAAARRPSPEAHDQAAGPHRSRPAREWGDEPAHPSRPDAHADAARRTHDDREAGGRGGAGRAASDQEALRAAAADLARRGRGGVTAEDFSRSMPGHGRASGAHSSHPEEKVEGRPASWMLSQSAGGDSIRRCESASASASAMNEKAALRAAMASLWGTGAKQGGGR